MTHSSDRNAELTLATMASLVAISAAYEVNSNLTPTFFAHIVVAFAIAVILRPRSITLFLSLGGAIAIHCFVLLPRVRNHWLLLTIVLCGAFVDLASGLGTKILRAKKEDRARLLLDKLAPSLRCATILLYACTALSKLNSDYFVADVSCGGEVYNESLRLAFPFLPAASGAVVIAIAVVVLAIEALLPLLLLFPRGRPLALAIGIAFHLLLGAWMPHIATVIFALYVPFFPARSWDALSAALARMSAATRAGIRIAIALFFTVIHSVLTAVPFASSAFTQTLTIARWSWLAVFAVLGVVTMRHLARPSRAERGDQESPPTPRAFRLGLGGIAMMIVLVANALSPYVGLKSGLALTMYSNLRTEGRSPNHLFLPVRAMHRFHDDDHLVRVVTTDLPDLAGRGKRPAPIFRPPKGSGAFLLPLLQLRLWIDEARRNGQRDIRLVYVDDGVTHDLARAEDDPVVGAPVPFIARKILTYRPVTDGAHQACYW